MKKGLGRGLSSLFGDYDEYDIEEKTPNKPELEKNNYNIDDIKNSVVELDVGLIDRNENQPRKTFDEKALKDLSQSIKQHGIIQPLLVQKIANRYQIIAGERRFRAARLAGLKTVPVIIKEYTEEQVSEVAIIENLQREDLNPIESARAIQELMDKYNLTQEDVSEKIGKSRPAIANTLRLLTLPKIIINYIEQGKLTAGHARTLLSIENEKQMLEIAELVISKKLSVRELEQLVKKINKPIKQNSINNQSLELKDFINNLNRLFSTKVSVIGNDKKGRIFIDYYSAEDLQRIYDILNK